MITVSELQQQTLDSVRNGSNTATRCAKELNICGVTARGRLRHLLSIGLLDLGEPEGIGRSRATVYMWTGKPYREGQTRRKRPRRTFESKKVNHPVMDAFLALPAR